ncbi:flagellar hook capping protein [Anaerotignum faecicola]|nr:flagellar hook capping protein [Anaerotignum faecicola]
MAEEHLFPGYQNSIAQGPLQYIRPKTTKVKDNATSMDMSSFLQLMAVQLQNQDPMNPTSQDDYMMQLAQMVTVEAMTSMVQTSVTTYAASLVGKEVTVAAYDANGNYKTEVGVVTGVALFSGEPFIYIGENAYSLSSIMAVGRVPEAEEPEKPDGGDGEDGGTEGGGSVEGGGETEGGGSVEGGGETEGGGSAEGGGTEGDGSSESGGKTES